METKQRWGARHRAAETLECKLFSLQQLLLLTTFTVICCTVEVVRLHCITQLPGARGVNAGGRRRKEEEGGEGSCSVKQGGGQRGIS